MCNLKKGLLIGAILGIATGTLMTPCFDRKTKRCMRKAKKRLRCVAEDTYDNIASMIK